RAAASYRMRSCQLEYKQGGGQIELTAFSNWDRLDFRAKEDGGGYLTLALSKALVDLRLIGPFELVTGLTYSPQSKFCSVDERVHEVSCQEDASQLGVTVVKTDNDGISHERQRSLQLDGVNLNLHSKKDGDIWELGLEKDGKWARVEPVRLFSCLSGSGS